MVLSFHRSGNSSFIQTELISVCIPTRNTLLQFRFIPPKLHFVVLNINVNLPVAKLIYNPLICIPVCLISFIPSTSNNCRKSYSAVQNTERICKKITHLLPYQVLSVFLIFRKFIYVFIQVPHTLTH